MLLFAHGSIREGVHRLDFVGRSGHQHSFYAGEEKKMTNQYCDCNNMLTKLQGSEMLPQDFPGGPVGKTPCSQCRGPRFDPWSGK